MRFRFVQVRSFSVPGGGEGHEAPLAHSFWVMLARARGRPRRHIPPVQHMRVQRFPRSSYGLGHFVAEGSPARLRLPSRLESRSNRSFHRSGQLGVAGVPLGTDRLEAEVHDQFASALRNQGHRDGNDLDALAPDEPAVSMRPGVRNTVHPQRVCSCLRACLRMSPACYRLRRTSAAAQPARTNAPSAAQA